MLTGKSCIEESSQARARALPSSVRSADVTSGRPLFPRVTWKTRTAGGVGGRSLTNEITSFNEARLTSCPQDGVKESRSSTPDSVGGKINVK